jgi:hypothetical protein
MAIGERAHIRPVRLAAFLRIVTVEVGRTRVEVTVEVTVEATVGRASPFPGFLLRILRGAVGV